jgi:hypothetical protein
MSLGRLGRFASPLRLATEKLDGLNKIETGLLGVAIPTANTMKLAREP